MTRQEQIAAKGALPYGKFLPWLEQESQWGQAQAYRLIQVAEKFINLINLPFEQSAMRLWLSVLFPVWATAIRWGAYSEEDGWRPADARGPEGGARSISPFGGSLR